MTQIRIMDVNTPNDSQSFSYDIEGSLTLGSTSPKLRRNAVFKNKAKANTNPSNKNKVNSHKSSTTTVGTNMVYFTDKHKIDFKP
jgi:hypothetical protein